MLISQAQIDAYIRNGSVLVDGLLPFDLIERASAGMDRLYATSEQHTGIKQYLDEPALVDLFQHPHFEETAKAVLGCTSVHLLATATLHTEPSPGTWGYDPATEHVDIQYTLNDWITTPRRIIITFMVFLDDIPADRAPTVVRPGSHLQIAEHNDDTAFQDHPVNIKDLPKLDYAEPHPLCGRKGQVAISTTALIHAGSRNVSDKPRKMLFVTYADNQVTPNFNANLIDKRLAWLETMAQRFAPERRHVVTSAVEQTRVLREHAR